VSQALTDRVQPSLVPQPVRAVTWRSVLLGLVGVVSICALSPYNDWVVSNTFLIGNFMPTWDSSKGGKLSPSSSPPWWSKRPIFSHSPPRWPDRRPWKRALR